MRVLGEATGITFDFNTYIDRQPIDSQRLLLWAGRFGKAEEFMTALSDRHFQQGSQGESASKRPTLVAAAYEVGLDVAKVEAFLDSDELHEEVWRSYGEMPRKGINGIPLFCFSIPEVGLWSGPFHDANADATVHGSANQAQFLHLFEQLYKYVDKALGAKLKREGPLVVGPPPATEAEVARDGVAEPRAAAHKKFIGREVRLVGLQSKPELNGVLGVCERFDERQGRYAIRLPGHEKPLALHGGNLELVRDPDKDEL